MEDWEKCMQEARVRTWIPAGPEEGLFSRVLSAHLQGSRVFPGMAIGSPSLQLANATVLLEGATA